jgi:hypothetical protein
MSHVPQAELAWQIPAYLSETEFRRRLGQALRKRPIDGGWDRLFNHVASDGAPAAPSLFRFFSRNHETPIAGITIVGADGNAWLLSHLFPLLEAMQQDLGAGAPQIRHHKAYWEHRPERYQAHKIVIRSKTFHRDARCKEHFHANLMDLAPYLQEIVASGINRQALALGLEDPCLTATDVLVHSIGGFGSQPVEGGAGRGMLPRIKSAVFTLPVKLVGSWHVGPLQSYGNGRVMRAIEIDKIRAAKDQASSMRVAA